MLCNECKGERVLIPGGDKKHAIECPHCGGTGVKEDEDETG